MLSDVWNEATSLINAFQLQCFKNDIDNYPIGGDLSPQILKYRLHCIYNKLGRDCQQVCLLALGILLQTWLGHY